MLFHPASLPSGHLHHPLSALPDRIDDQLNAARVALDNAETDADLQAGLAAYGYDAAALADGRARLDAAQAAQDDVSREYGEQYEATDALAQTREAAEAVYGPHLALARVAFRADRDARTALALGGRRRATTAGWIEQAEQFYANAIGDADVEAGLGRFNVTPADLEAGRDAVAAVAAANAEQEREKGEAQKATETRDEALDALQDWMVDFRDVARVAFRDDPQQLEKLGLLARS